MFAKIALIAKNFTIFGLGLIGLLVIIWGIAPYIIQPKYSKNIVIINYDKDGQKGKVYFAQLLPNSASWKLIKLDDLAETQVMGKADKYYLSALQAIMEQDQRPVSYQLAAFSWVLNVRVDEIWQWRGDFEPTTQPKLKAKLRREILSSPGTFQTKWQQLTQLCFLRRVALENYFYQSEPVALEKLSALLEPVYFENCSVAVVNTTPTPGLARQLSNLVESGGAVVLRVVDQTETYDQSTFAVLADKLACEPAITAVSRFFPQEIQVVTRPELNQQQRADLVIMIGQDLAREFE